MAMRFSFVAFCLSLLIVVGGADAATIFVIDPVQAQTGGDLATVLPTLTSSLPSDFDYVLLKGLATSSPIVGIEVTIAGQNIGPGNYGSILQAFDISDGGIAPSSYRLLPGCYPNCWPDYSPVPPPPVDYYRALFDFESSPIYAGEVSDTLALQFPANSLRSDLVDPSTGLVSSGVMWAEVLSNSVQGTVFSGYEEAGPGFIGSNASQLQTADSIAPEPSTFILLGLGMSLFGVRWKYVEGQAVRSTAFGRGDFPN